MSASGETIRARIRAELVARSHLILDGPTGTGLEARGFRSHSDLWTASAAQEAPELLAAVHRDYRRAGAQLITANTFRTTAARARTAGLARPEEVARALLRASVALAAAVCREGSDPAALCAGSLAPLADCYPPEDTPPDEILATEHARTAAELGAAGCDLILIETQGSAREARIAVTSARASCDRPIWVSLFDGDSLLDTAAACAELGAEAVLVNCAHADVCERALEALQPLRRNGIPLGAYANADRLELAALGGGLRFVADPAPLAAQIAAYADAARRFRDRLGAVLLGGCCGMTPGHIAALSAI
jgi:S-methylmethionine-dependent homocysteine/selenocysteine methylase